MTACAIGFAPRRRKGPAMVAVGDIRRTAYGVMDVVHLAPGIGSTPRDRLRAVLEVYRAGEALLPLQPRHEVPLDEALALLERAQEGLLQRLHDIAQICEVEVSWRAHRGRTHLRSTAPPPTGAAWLRARARQHADADRRCAALLAGARGRSVSILRSHADQEQARAVIAAPRAEVEALCASIGARARNPALRDGSVMVTGPWPAFTLAGDVLAEAM